MPEFRVMRVIDGPYMRAWACEAIRAESQRVSSRKWRWRVWAVLGGDTLYEGVSLGRRRADDMAIGALIVAANNGRLANA